ncbi:uncharacterized protein [Palaemon carinicauda]|uniref:uncharacterized protein isoform X2 n=1 Tax=Palaemon carinicauda TaxID=392227 RepID=UPI0035B612E4
MTSLRIMFTAAFVILCVCEASGRKHSSHSENRRPPTYSDLGAAVAGGLVSLARSAHRPASRLGIDIPLDPLRSSSELKYVHEGDLLHLKLVLDNVTLIGFKSLTVQEVTFKRPDDGFSREPWAADTGGGGHHYRGEEEEQDYDYSEGDLYPYDDWSRMEMQDSPTAGATTYQKGAVSRGRTPRGSDTPSSSEGIIRVAFKQMAVKAKYQVRGNAEGYFTFRESGDLTLTSPTVFLTTRLNVTLPGFGYHPHQTAIPRHGRVKVLWARSNVSIGSTSLLLQPGAYPPEFVRQQVQSKLEELTSDLSHGHGAVRLLLRRWGRLVKRLIHRTAQSLTK